MKGSLITSCFATGGYACISAPCTTVWSSVASRPKKRRLGGIIIPDNAKEKPQEGEVVAVGPGARDDGGQLVELTVKPGDRVLFGKWSGTEAKIDGEELLIMKESDILGIVEDTVSLKQAA